MTKPDFSKIFAQTGLVTALTDPQFLQGLAYLGDNPPTKEEFNWLFQQLCLKFKWLDDTRLDVANPTSLTTASGILTLPENGDSFIINGNETITQIAGRANGIVILRWNTVRTITYNAVSLILQSGINRSTAVGDVGIYEITAAGAREITYFPATSAHLALSGGTLTGALNEALGANIASVATTNIGAATGNFITVTGTATITNLGTVAAGTRRIVRFASALTLANSASLILPGGANIITATGDVFEFVSLGSGNWICTNFQPAAAFLPLSGGALSGALNEALGTNIASASTINLTTATGNLVHITGTTTITAVTLGAGMRREVIFDGILTLTHHVTNNHLPGHANITTAAGDMATYWSDGTTVYCTKYQKADGTAVIVPASVTIASTIEARAGTDNTKVLTPLRLREGLNASGAAPIYVCRAWVNFNGTGTVAIRASGNVSSITDNGVGDYTVNFTTALPDTNYCWTSGVCGEAAPSTAVNALQGRLAADQTVSSLRVYAYAANSGAQTVFDASVACISIFR